MSPLEVMYDNAEEIHTQLCRDYYDLALEIVGSLKMTPARELALTKLLESQQAALAALHMDKSLVQ